MYVAHGNLESEVRPCKTPGVIWTVKARRVLARWPAPAPFLAHLTGPQIDTGILRVYGTLARDEQTVKTRKDAESRAGAAAKH